MAGHLSVNFSHKEALSVLGFRQRYFVGVTGRKRLVDSFDLFILWNGS